MWICREMFCEGTVYDWSSVYFSSVVKPDEAFIRAGYVAAHLLQLLGELDERIIGMHRADGIDEAALDLRFLWAVQRRIDSDLEIADIVERIEDAEDTDAVLGCLLDEFLDDIIGVMIVSEEVLAAQEHLDRRLEFRLQRIETLPRIFIEEAEAGVERCAAPSLEGLIADLVECFELREHVLDAHARRTERLMAIAEDGLHDFYGFCHDKTLQCSNNF